MRVFRCDTTINSGLRKEAQVRVGRKTDRGMEKRWISEIRG